MALCVCGQLHANAETMDDGTDDLVPSGINEDMLRQIEPTYLKEVAVPSAWSSNWFVGMSGGISTFVGKPHGTGNLFDRMKPSLAIEAGKWFTPEIGGRFSFPSNPQPIGFRGNLLVKRQKFFYCTYSLGITETS